jgi:glycosyltransferase involved in cell wall biosynthesis
MAAPLRVLAISSYGGLGGSELATVDFIAHRPPGIEVEVLLVSRGQMEDLLDVPTRVGRDYEGRPGPRELLRFSRSLASLLRARPPDVVWAVGSKAALLSVAASRATGTPIVWHKVDFVWDRELTRPLAAAVNWVIAVSDALVEPLGPLRERRYLGRVTPPLRLTRDVESRNQGSRPAIGTVSRLVPYKGIHHILRAAALLVDDFPGLRVLIAGGPALEYPDYPASLANLAQELGIAERLELLGHVQDVASVYERLDVFLSATYLDHEGFGLEGLGSGILEASWARVPVVVARAGGNVEALEPGVTGTLVESVEAEALAAGARPYLRDPDLARRTGEAGREFALRRGIEPRVASARLFHLLSRAAVSGPP